MKPRNRFEKEVESLSKRLSPPTARQIDWAKRKLFPGVGVSTSKETWCTCCGGRMVHIKGCDTEICPHCGEVLKVDESRRINARGNDYFTKAQVVGGIQVFRHFWVRMSAHRDRATRYEVTEVVREWIDREGRYAVQARRTGCFPSYSDGWSVDSEMSIKNAGSGWHSQEGWRYRINALIVPGARYLAVAKKYGYKPQEDIPPASFMRMLFNVTIAETLAKNGQWRLLTYMWKEGLTAFNPQVQAAIRIADRHRYVIEDAQIWVETIRAMAYLGMDCHNPKYVCADDLRTLHDRVTAKRAKIEAERKARSREQDYKTAKKAFFGIILADSDIKVAVLPSVAAFAAEGQEMHHCVFNMAYYDKPDSLILSATDSQGQRLETIEVNLKTFQVVQSRGRFNKPTPMHERIIALVNRNMNVIKQAAHADAV